ncbi:cyclic nucleotide-binding domain-containing protein [Algibacter sp.]|nr:cyclic nucleotide-binding domain-containing protein [Algibacter sp.]
MNITDFLITLVPFSHDELNDILPHFEKENVQKNQVLIKEGQVCNKLYFIEQGLGRSYYLKEDGKEVSNGSLELVNLWLVWIVTLIKALVYII